MKDASTLEKEREELRRRWLAAANSAFDMMFDPQSQDKLTTFDQREQQAFDLSRDLGAWLLQQHTNADPLATPGDCSEQSCPKCGKPGRPVTDLEKPLPKRSLCTRIGDVTLRREKFRCTTCRVVFFPPGPETLSGHGGL